MPPIVALIVCIVFVLGILRIERKQNPEVSHALWVPTFWMLICGSRPIVMWFVPYSILEWGGSDEAGSPLDRLVLSILVLLAILILSRRKIEWSRILKDNFWLIFLYLYLGFSILWSDFPFVSLKRWIRLSGAIPIAMVVLSERLPLEALGSVFRRCAYVLIPFSLLLIKYFGHLGRAYDRWSGQLMWTGVTMQKNSLGLLCAFSAFFLIWAFLRQRRVEGFSKNRYQTFSDGLVFAIAVFLLAGPGGSYSATSIAVLIVGIAMLLPLYRMENLARLIAAHLKAVVVALALISLSLYETLAPTMISMLGRDESFTGRIDIWSVVLDVASRNPLLGVGYGGYWGLEDEITSAVGVGQAHSGYLGVYLEAGIVGIVVLFVFLLALCDKVRKETNHAFDWGVFGFCFLLMALLYNYSEDTFLKTSYLWSALVFLTVVFSEPCLHKNGG